MKKTELELRSFRKTCDNCGFPLWGKKHHGFVVGMRRVCGTKKDCDERKVRAGR